MSAPTPSRHYDLIAIGSGPAGRGAALEAAALGRRVALIERAPCLGGGWAGRGALPFQALRAAVLGADGGPPGVHRRPPAAGSAPRIGDLAWRAPQVVERERRTILDGLRRSHVDVIAGSASFAEAGALIVSGDAGAARVSADFVVIAVGTVPATPPGAEPDGHTVLQAEDLLALPALPATITIVGAGATGLAYASVVAALGARVTVVDQRARLLGAADREVVEGLRYHLRGLGVGFRLGERVEAVERLPGGGAVTRLAGGGHVASEVVLHAAGRRGATAGLRLRAAGLRADGRGRLAVDDHLRTARPHVLAAGGVIGGPALAPVAMEQGRRAARVALGATPRHPPAPVPWTVPTIPELAWVGRTEYELTEAGIPVVAAVAPFRDLARGDLIGDRSGFLKLIVDADTRRALGVHILGTSAAELVHVGQVAMASGVPVDALAEAVYGAPTLAEAYRAAALDALARIGDRRGGAGHRGAGRAAA